MPRSGCCSLPLGFWEADMDQLNSSAERSSKSRQSVMALVRRMSPKTLPKFEIIEMTSRIISRVLIKDPTNWFTGTFKQLFWRSSVMELACAVHTGRKNVSNKRKSERVEISDILVGCEKVIVEWMLSKS